MDVVPEKQNIDRVFSNILYHIDFYQRDYRWTEEPVKRLLDDIFYKFREQYERTPDLDPGQETITKHYPWYYLNTYVTNEVGGKIYLVDGQQRLTTLTLILIKLHHLAKQYGSKLRGWIDRKIAGESGYDREFWVYHISQNNVLQALYDGCELKTIDVRSGITAQNMVLNYNIIENWLDKELPNLHKFETFVFYFLLRLVLITLSVEKTNVPMVFEVINDRGVRLRPYEILKGKLLGQIDKSELDSGNYNNLWESHAASINSFREDEFDNLFRFYLKAKLVATRKEGQKFDGDYHREMFSNEMDKFLALSHNPLNVKKFLNGPFKYYCLIYSKLLEAYKKDNIKFRHVYFNALLDLDAPFLLVLSACDLNDPNEDEKIRVISREIDRYFSLLQLQNVYDSNEFANSLYPISEEIREKPVSSFRTAFDKQLIAMIASRRNTSQAEPLVYSAFKQTGTNLNTRFKRYFFARIDEFLAENLNLNPKHSISDLVTKTGAKTGFHVEHILSHNEENLVLFENDEERFEQERNRLGGILLLKGKDEWPVSHFVTATALPEDVGFSTGIHLVINRFPALDRVMIPDERARLFLRLARYIGTEVPARFLQRTGEEHPEWGVAHLHSLQEGIYKPAGSVHALTVKSRSALGAEVRGLP